MTIADFISDNMAVLNMISEYHIQPQDVKLIGLYKEASGLIAEGKKVGWIAQSLAEKYGISVRKFYYVMERMGRVIT